MLQASTLPAEITSTQALGFLLRTMSRRRKLQLLATMILMVAGAAAELVTIGATLPFLALISDPSRLSRMPVIGTMLQSLGARAPGQQFVAATLFLIGAVTIATFVRLVLTWVSQKFVFRLGHDINVRIYERLLYQPYELHAARNTGDVISGFEKVNIVLSAVLMPGVLAITSSFMSAVIIVTLLVIDPFTALISAASLSLLYVGISLATRVLLARNGQIIAHAYALRVRQIQEGLGGIRDVLITHCQPLFVENFRRTDNRLRGPMVVNSFITSSPRIVIEAFGIGMIAALALYMSRQPGGVLGAIPVLGALAIGAQRLLPLLQQTYTGWSQAVGNLQSVIDVVRLMDIPTRTPSPVAADTASFRTAIACAGVTFAYRDCPPALHDIDLVIRKGERVGFIGETGSGKSTLIDLLMGLLPPSLGEVRIDGAPLTEDSRAQWQRQIAHVPQTIYLTDATIAENIAFGVPADRIDMGRVRQAAERAQIASFIDGLPDTFASEIGERGVRLSGGQRQRLGIARAFYQNKPCLVLDEATSALDDVTERAVIQSIDTDDEDTTVIMIAHRLSTLAACDRIFRVHAGRITQSGTFAEVVG